MAFANGYSPSTTFTMPAKAVTVTATYRNIFYTFKFSNKKEDGEIPDDYEIGDVNMTTLNAHLTAYYDTDGAKEVRNFAQDYLSIMNKERPGHCFGMSLASILDYNGQVDFKKYNSPVAASTLADVQNPKDNVKVLQAINYYQLSILIKPDSFLRGSVDWGPSKVNDVVREREQVLENLVAQSKKGEPILFWFKYNDNRSSHTIVITGYDEKNSVNNHKLFAYDCNDPSNGSIVEISKDHKSCTIKNYPSIGAVYAQYTFGSYAIAQADADNSADET